jgi:membrane fusion protein, multidrug efflux system
MSRIRFHQLAALIVLIGFAGWVATGKFSSVGSASAEAEQAKAAVAQAPPQVRTVAVVAPPHIQHARAIRMSGQTEANQRASLAVRSNGVIDRIMVKQGDRVKPGELILALAAEEKTAAIEMARQVLLQRQAEADAAERLVKTGSMAKLQADNARSGLATARSLLEAATAEVTRNEVRAPFDGVVDRVPVETGSSVMQGALVATILNLDPILAVGEVSERDLGYLNTGDEAEIRLISGQIVKGKVRYISRDASPQTRTFRIEVAIPNGDGSVPAGMTAEITLRAAPTDAVILPRSVATLNKKGELGIRAVDKDGKVTFHPIDLVDDTPTGLVLAGIPADARVIVAGQDLVTEGDQVKAVAADPAMVKRLAGGDPAAVE